ncbi:melanocortin-2 receptor accessory protein 2A [Scomber japonicus]|uniref:melanocortin-2 receptor accessory protein 2A n=1 Tax=Scomber japonicus TaxID=13676 RepID=UPI0023068C1D|nr:melanocortin-2 receptor accessory protein 2A [Scomber japonicus]
MSGSDSPNSSSVPPVLDYEWRYEYYDDEEPVSFEGLRAHRYSIVIGFWVGLAVFVIFMFFLLTLLTKTGAPHPDGQPCEKRPRLIGYMDTNLDKGAPPSHPCGLDSSRSLFQCYVSKEVQGSCTALWTTPGAVGGGTSGGHMRMENEPILLAHFNIPNFVNSEQSLTVGEDDLLLGDPPVSLKEIE